MKLPNRLSRAWGQQKVNPVTTMLPAKPATAPMGAVCANVRIVSSMVVANGAGRITSGLGYIPRDLGVARLIDHTLLKPDASAAEIAQLCREAREYHFASVCVNSTNVPLCADLLKGSDVAVCTVVGFPLGASPAEVKAYEAQLAIQNGATEIDMVMNIGALKSRDIKGLYNDIATVVKNCHAHNVICKVIFETSQAERRRKSHRLSGVQRWPGRISSRPAPASAVAAQRQRMWRLMRKVVGPDIGVKASGGVRNLQDAQAMVKAGATRIGASAGVAIVKAERGENVGSTREGVLMDCFATCISVI